MYRYVISAVLALNSVSSFAQTDEVTAEPAQPQVAPAATAEQAAPAPAAEESSERQWRVGPSIAIGAMDLIRFGVDARINPSLGVGVSYGYIPSVELLSTKISISSFKAHVQWYPFAGSFFVGGAVGTQSIEVKKTEKFDASNGVPAGTEGDVKIDVSSTFVTPMMGWNWGSSDGGLFVGMDLGVQIPMSNSTDLKTKVSPAAHEANVKATKDYQDAEKDVKDAGDKIGKQVIPHLTFLRIGWLF